MLRVAFILPTQAAEHAVDALVPLLPRGVHERELPGGRTEASFYEYAGALPPRDELEAAAGTSDWTEDEVPDDPLERRRRYGRAWEVAGRLRIPSPHDPPGDGGVPELVIESAAGRLGPARTRRPGCASSCCSRSILAARSPTSAAAPGCSRSPRRGSVGAPVFAVDHEPQSVAASRRNAERNGTPVEALQLDLAAVAPPPAPTLAANVPPPIHAPIAATLAPAVIHVIASGFVESGRDAVVALYASAGFTPVERLGDGWQAVLLERPR
ncbi:MAG TPA: hypothetical protein VK631_21375 [Solirubrobacteraceae bacterium]|nr:hypothetical protein [Solirubrobacteraceae bacterium]